MQKADLVAKQCPVNMSSCLSLSFGCFYWRAEFLSSFTQCSFNFYLRKLEAALSSIQLFYSTYPHAASTAVVLVKCMGEWTNLESFPHEGCASAHSECSGCCTFTCWSSFMQDSKYLPTRHMWGRKNCNLANTLKDGECPALVGCTHSWWCQDWMGVGQIAVFILSVEARLAWSSTGLARRWVIAKEGFQYLIYHLSYRNFVLFGNASFPVHVSQKSLASLLRLILYFQWRSKRSL